MTESQARITVLKRYPNAVAKRVMISAAPNSAYCYCIYDEPEGRMLSKCYTRAMAWKNACWCPLVPEKSVAAPVAPVQQKSDYKRARDLGLTQKDRWNDGIDHHPMSRRLMKFLGEHDFCDYDDHFCWKIGGDGDNGEALMYEMDAFFELLDKEGKES